VRYWLQMLNSQPEDLVELCRFVEELGFEGVLEGDHWFMPALSDDHDPDERGSMPWDYSFLDIFAAGGTVLASTKTLKFGSGVMIVANRTNPFLVAKGAASLARLSGDRFVLGVGIGWMKEEYEMAGVEWSTRAARTEEMIAVLRKLWGEGPTEHHGKFFEFGPTYALPQPTRPVPIYIGSVAPPGLRRTGRIGDGWMGMASPLDAIPDQIRLVNEGRREAGREHEPFEMLMGLASDADGRVPGIDEHRRARDMGITQFKFGPVEHRLGKLYCSLDEKKRAIEAFANDVIRTGL
jgi:probable F420-dependent oxidoreductase